MAGGDDSVTMMLTIKGDPSSIIGFRKQLQDAAGGINIGISPASLGKAKSDLKSVMVDIGGNKIAGELKMVTNAAGQATTATDRVAESTKRAATEMNQFAERIGFTTNRLLGYVIPATLFWQTFKFAKDAKDSVISLNKQLSEMTQIMEGDSERAKSVAGSVGQIATRYGQSTKEIMTMANLLAQSGPQFSKTEDLLDSVANIAKTKLVATFGDVQQTTEGMIAYFGQFNLTAKDTVRILDVANQLSKKFAVESGDLFTAVRTGGPAAALSGDTPEKFMAIVTTLRQLTRINAQQIGTGLNTVMMRTLRPETLKIQETLANRMGRSIYKTNGELKDFTDRILAVSQGYAQLARVEKSAVSEKLFGYRMARFGQPLLEDAAKQQGVLKQALDETENGVGSFNRDAASGMKRIEVQVASVGSAFQESFLKIAQDDSFLTFVKDITDSLKVLADVLKFITPLLGSAFRIGAGALLGKGVMAIPAVAKGFGFYGAGKFGNVKNKSGDGGTISGTEGVSFAGTNYPINISGTPTPVESLRNKAFVDARTTNIQKLINATNSVSGLKQKRETLERTLTQASQYQWQRGHMLPMIGQKMMDIESQKKSVIAQQIEVGSKMVDPRTVVKEILAKERRDPGSAGLSNAYLKDRFRYSWNEQRRMPFIPMHGETGRTEQFRGDLWRSGQMKQAAFELAGGPEQLAFKAEAVRLAQEMKMLSTKERELSRLYEKVKENSAYALRTGRELAETQKALSVAMRQKVNLEQRLNRSTGPLSMIQNFGINSLRMANTGFQKTGFAKGMDRILGSQALTGSLAFIAPMVADYAAQNYPGLQSKEFKDMSNYSNLARSNQTLGATRGGITGAAFGAAMGVQVAGLPGAAAGAIIGGGFGAFKGYEDEKENAIKAGLVLTSKEKNIKGFAENFGKVIDKTQEPSLLRSMIDPFGGTNDGWAANAFLANNLLGRRDRVQQSNFDEFLATPEGEGARQRATEISKAMVVNIIKENPNITKEKALEIYNQRRSEAFGGDAKKIMYFTQAVQGFFNDFYDEAKKVNGALKEYLETMDRSIDIYSNVIEAAQKYNNGIEINILRSKQYSGLQESGLSIMKGGLPSTDLSGFVALTTRRLQAQLTEGSLGSTVSSGGLLNSDAGQQLREISNAIRIVDSILPQIKDIAQSIEGDSDVAPQAKSIEANKLITEAFKGSSGTGAAVIENTFRQMAADTQSFAGKTPQKIREEILQRAALPDLAFKQIANNAEILAIQMSQLANANKAAIEIANQLNVVNEQRVRIDKTDASFMREIGSITNDTYGSLLGNTVDKNYGNFGANLQTAGDNLAIARQKAAAASAAFAYQSSTNKDTDITLYFKDLNTATRNLELAHANYTIELQKSESAITLVTERFGVLNQKLQDNIKTYENRGTMSRGDIYRENMALNRGRSVGLAVEQLNGAQTVAQLLQSTSKDKIVGLAQNFGNMAQNRPELFTRYIEALKNQGGDQAKQGVLMQTLAGVASKGNISDNIDELYRQNNDATDAGKQVLDALEIQKNLSTKLANVSSDIQNLVAQIGVKQTNEYQTEQFNKMAQTLIQSLDSSKFVTSVNEMTIALDQLVTKGVKSNLEAQINIKGMENLTRNETVTAKAISAFARQVSENLQGGDDVSRMIKQSLIKAADQIDNDLSKPRDKK